MTPRQRAGMFLAGSCIGLSGAIVLGTAYVAGHRPLGGFLVTAGLLMCWVGHVLTDRASR